MKIKFLLVFFIIATVLYSDDINLNKYLKLWLKKDDSVMMFDYRTGAVLFEYHPYMYEKKIPIGSVFKIVTTFLFYKNNNNTSYTYNCNNLNDDGLFCWDKKGHGRVNIKSAFIHSCNKFYYSLNLPLDSLKRTSKYLGLNISFNLHNLKKREKKLILAGNLPRIEANFYELSKLLSIFANRGLVVDIKTKNKLYSVKEIDIINKIRKLMLKVVKEGTAKGVFFKNHKLSGKTGTAKDKNNKLNGLFIGFTVDKPYAIIVNVKNNIGAGAAMIASDIIYLYEVSKKR